MIAWTPMPLRWTERAEAAQLCALAALECEPRAAIARQIVEGMPRSASRLSFAAWLVDWFAQPRLEIKQDGNWPDGL